MVVIVLPLLVSLKVYCLLFNVLFILFSVRTIFILAQLIVQCQHFFKIFLNIFLIENHCIFKLLFVVF